MLYFSIRTTTVLLLAVLLAKRPKWEVIHKQCTNKKKNTFIRILLHSASCNFYWRCSKFLGRMLSREDSALRKVLRVAQNRRHEKSVWECVSGLVVLGSRHCEISEILLRRQPPRASSVLDLPRLGRLFPSLEGGQRVLLKSLRSPKNQHVQNKLAS